MSFDNSTWLRPSSSVPFTHPHMLFAFSPPRPQFAFQHTPVHASTFSMRCGVYSFTDIFCVCCIVAAGSCLQSSWLLLPMNLLGESLLLVGTISLQNGPVHGRAFFQEATMMSESLAVSKISEADGFAQVYPEHKYMVVEFLQKNNNTIGMVCF